MKLLILAVISLLSACIHAPAPTVPTGEDISKTSGEAARKSLSEGSPALYSTSVEEAPVAEVAETPAVAPTFQVMMHADGSFESGGDRYSVEMLKSTLSGHEGRGPLEFVVAPQVLHGDVVGAMDIARSLGYTQIMIKEMPATEAPSEPAP